MVNSEDGAKIPYPTSPDDWIEWTRRWWESMMEIKKELNPIADPDGRNFKLFRQPADSENVWFLAGNLGNKKGEETTRYVDVKKGKAIFMPIINYIGCQQAGFGKPNLPKSASDSNLFIHASDSKIKSEAENDINKSKGKVKVKYDGVTKKMRKRVKTPLWNLKFAKPPVMGDRSGEAKCLSDGIWVFTEPLLKVGKTATITVHAANDVFQSDVTYKIHIIP